MFVFILLFVLAAVGADSTSAAPSVPGNLTSADGDAHRASSDTAAPSNNFIYDQQRHNNNTRLDEPSIGCFTILGVVSKQLPALNRSLAELSDVLAQNPAQSRMLAPIRELVDYMEFVQHSPAYSRRTVPNKALQHMGEAATLIKNIIGQTRLTSDAAAMEAMQSILASVLTVNEYLLVHERYHHHHSNFNMDEVDKEMLEEAGSGSEDWVPAADDADAENKAEDKEEERVLARFHRTDPSNVLKNGREVNRRVANDFLHTYPRPHTQAECCLDDCQFDDCCPNCCICCPTCMEPPAGELPPVVPPANAA